jgi:hypothetical protein
MLQQLWEISCRLMRQVSCLAARRASRTVPETAVMATILTRLCVATLPAAGYHYDMDWTPYVGGTCTPWNGS